MNTLKCKNNKKIIKNTQKIIKKFFNKFQNSVNIKNLKIKMLNTIYEEFDFESRIKDLKNKRIKIRRYVKNSEEIKPCIYNKEIKEKIQLM